MFTNGVVGQQLVLKPTSRTEWDICKRGVRSFPHREMEQSEQKAAPKRDSLVQSVERAMLLLERLGEQEDGLRLTEIAERASLSPSTTHRLLTTLQKRRFVEFDRVHGLWHVGRQCFTVGSTFVRRRNFVAVAMPFLRELRDKTRETANIGIIEDGALVTLAQVESREIMRATARVGGRSPIHATAMGKAILATYPPASVEGVIGRINWLKLTDKTIRNETELRICLAQNAADGYAVDDEEFVLGLRCVAAPVIDRQGEAFFAVSISGLAGRVTRERIETIGPMVRATAHAISNTLDRSSGR